MRPIPLPKISQLLWKWRFECWLVQLIYCPIIMNLMSRQQDKSKDINAPSSPLHSAAHPQDPPVFNIRPLPDSPGVKFFDKFKHPDYELFSAFRLVPEGGHRGTSPAARKEPVIRKHRGNYRKYTVTEKEEAVKQILEGVDAKEISEKYGIPRRNLLRWKKNGCERKEGGGRPTDGEMQLTLYTKIDGKMLLTQKEIRVEAKRLSKMADFKASKGWYCKFSRRYNQWKKQERERIMRLEGHQGPFEDKEVFLLPEASDGSDDDSQSDFSDSSKRKDEQ